MGYLVAVELVGQTSSLTSKAYDAAKSRRSRLSQTLSDQGILLVGDTGFEPVTSSVSGQNLCP